MTYSKKNKNLSRQKIEKDMFGGSLYLNIVNPHTGRKVSVFGKLGQKIIKNYITNLGSTIVSSEDHRH